MRYGSVCSGIEAATCAWHGLGWEPVWFSEIEKFPNRILQYHYPTVPNLGDMTKLAQHKTFNDEPIDLMVGGTPCQSFSIAGLRRGLDERRGNLSLEFCRLLIAKKPRWFVWENVPGVSSSSGGRDFETILAAFQECGYSCAWRVLDAQYYGVPQRRRRVFVIGYFGTDWRPPFAVLFERESLRRDFEAGAKARQKTTGKAGGDIETTVGFKMNGFGDNHQSHSASSLKKRDHKDATDLVVQPPVSYSLQGNMIGRKDENGPQGDGVNEGTSFTLNKTDRHAVVSIALDEDKNAHIENSGTLRGHTSGGKEHLVVSYAIQTGQTGQTGANGSNISEDISPSLTKGDKHAVVAFANQNSEHRTMNVDTISPTLEKNKIHSVVDTRIYQQDEIHMHNEVMSTLVKGTHNNAGHHTKTFTGSIARRLTPLECERLQGFPDNYTLIPGAKDGPRYAAIGNSMAVPVMRWIGERIDVVDKIIRK